MKQIRYYIPIILRIVAILIVVVGVISLIMLSSIPPKYARPSSLGYLAIILSTIVSAASVYGFSIVVDAAITYLDDRNYSDPVAVTEE